MTLPEGRIAGPTRDHWLIRSPRESVSVAEDQVLDISPRDAELRAFVEFRSIAAELVEDCDFDTIARVITAKLATLSGIPRCSLHVMDSDAGLLRPIAVHDPGVGKPPPPESEYERIPCNFATEIMRTRRSTILDGAANRPTEPHAVRITGQSPGTWLRLAVPMVLRDEVVGVLCLDREETDPVLSAGDHDAVEAFAELAAVAVNQVAVTSRLRKSLDKEAWHLNLLKQVGRMERQLTELVVSGCSIRDLVDTISRLLGKPVAIYNESYRCLAMSAPPTEGTGPRFRLLDEDIRAALTTVLDELEPAQPVVVGPLPRLGLFHRLVVTLVVVDGKRWGYVVVAERPTRFGPLDAAVVRRAAANIALEEVRARRAGKIEWHAIEAFTGSLIRGEHVALEERAQVLGINLHAPRVVCLVAAHDAAGIVDIAPQTLARMMTTTESPSAVLATPSGNDIALVVELPADRRHDEAVAAVRNRMAEVLADLQYPTRLDAAISCVARAPRDDLSAHTEANQVLQCMRSHMRGSDNHVLGADDLGAGRLLLASTDHSEAQRFARNALGPLMSATSTKCRALLLTLHAFLQSGRSISRTAALLDVHANTVRYRLSSIARLTGLDIASDDADFLTAQIAVLVLKLNGWLSLIPSRAAIGTRTTTRTRRSSRSGVRDGRG